MVTTRELLLVYAGKDLTISHFLLCMQVTFAPRPRKHEESLMPNWDMSVLFSSLRIDSAVVARLYFLSRPYGPEVIVNDGRTLI
jgi:hypothetical protein